MTFESIILSDDEIAEAVGHWLSKHGISVPVDKISKNYTSSGAWKVELKEPDVAVEPAPAPAQVATTS